jgi:hypothetical protein
MKLIDLFEAPSIELPLVNRTLEILHNPSARTVFRQLGRGIALRGLADHENIFLGDGSEILHLQLLRALQKNTEFFADKKLHELINVLILSPTDKPERGYGIPFKLCDGSFLYTFNRRREARTNRFLAALINTVSEK